MRNLEEVTEQEMKDAFNNTPVLCNHFTWEEVKSNQMLIISLKNQVISHEEKAMKKPTDSNVVFLAVEQRKEPPVFIGIDPAPAPDQTKMFPAPAPKKVLRRSTITLHEGQIEKIRNAVILGRNCLRSGHVNDLLRSEALSDLAEAQKIIQSFYEPRV